jgi:hypothetical protein
MGFYKKYSFAMTTPWGIIFNKNIFGFVHDNVLPVEANKLEDWLILGFWDWFTFYVGLEISALVVFKEFDHGFSRDVTGHNIFRNISS